MEGRSKAPRAPGRIRLFIADMRWNMERFYVIPIVYGYVLFLYLILVVMIIIRYM